MRQRDDTVERFLSRLASPDHGVVKRRQLVRDGVTVAEIRSRLKSGALIPEYRGIYRVGHQAPSVESRYLAAVWACGDRAFLAHRAAAFLHRLLAGSAPRPEVIAPTARRVPGVTTRRYSSLHATDVTTVGGIPVTSIARTLVDLARLVPENALARACHEAGVHYGTTPADVETVLSRRPNSPGAHKLRAVMRGDAKVLLSRLEEGFILLLRSADLPLPVTNRPAGGRRVDCRWPDHRLTVELGSFKYHNSRQSWERDLMREHEARARGDEFRRFSWGDVFERPRIVVGELRPLLSADRVSELSRDST